MWKIAVADTAEDHLTLLKDALKAYSQETHRVFSVTSYTDLTVLEKDMAQGEHFEPFDPGSCDERAKER